MRLSFGEVVLSVHTRELFRGGQAMHLAPKTFELLLLLVSRRPNAVSKQEILAHVWPDTHITDATLTSTISDVRQAIGDDARAPRLVRTLHRFGYAFTADVLQDEPGAASSQRRSTAGWLVGPSWRIPVYEGETVLGREGDGVVALPGSSVSRRHAALEVERGCVRLRDLGSKNGTFVDGVRLTAAATLKDGSRVRLGTFEATYRTGDGAESTETA